MTGGKKGGGGKGDKGAWKGYSAKGYTYIPTGPQWKAAAGSAGVPFQGTRQWAHPLQPACGKGLSWCQEQPAGYMLSMCREVTPTVQAVTPTATFALAQKDFTSTNTFAPLQGTFPSSRRNRSTPANRRHAQPCDKGRRHAQLCDRARHRLRSA